MPPVFIVCQGMTLGIDRQSAPGYAILFRAGRPTLDLITQRQATTGQEKSPFPTAIEQGVLGFNLPQASLLEPPDDQMPRGYNVPVAT